MIFRWTPGLTGTISEKKPTSLPLCLFVVCSLAQFFRNKFAEKHEYPKQIDANLNDPPPHVDHLDCRSAWHAGRATAGKGRRATEAFSTPFGRV